MQVRTVAVCPQSARSREGFHEAVTYGNMVAGTTSTKATLKHEGHDILASRNRSQRISSMAVASTVVKCAGVKNGYRDVIHPRNSEIYPT